MSNGPGTFIGKVVFICLKVSVNLVYNFQGQPSTTTVKHDFNPNGLKFHRGSPWVSILSWLNLKANKDYFSYEHVKRHLWWVVSHVNESCHTCEWVRSTCPAHAVPEFRFYAEKSPVYSEKSPAYSENSRMILKEFWKQPYDSERISEVMSHIWKRHVAKLCLIYDSEKDFSGAGLQIRKGHVTHTNGSCHTLKYEWLMSHIPMHHVATWGMLLNYIEFIWTYVTHMKEACRHILMSPVSYEWVISHVNGCAALSLRMQCLNYIFQIWKMHVATY